MDQSAIGMTIEKELAGGRSSVAGKAIDAIVLVGGLPETGMWCADAMRFSPLPFSCHRCLKLLDLRKR